MLNCTNEIDNLIGDLKTKITELESIVIQQNESIEAIKQLKEDIDRVSKYLSTSPNKRWRAEKNCKYYFIGTTSCISYYDSENGCSTDKLRYEMGNYFKTEEDAEFEIERLRVIAELKDWAMPINVIKWDDNTQMKYVISLENNHLKIGLYNSCQVCDLYFSSEKIAKDAIDAVGADRIIKYYFRRGERKSV